MTLGFHESIRNRIAAILLVVGLLYYLHPYYGIRHDAVLYLGQALSRLNPDQFSGDLFFAFGSQTQFTVVPHLLAALLANFSASSVFLALTVLGQATFVAASWFLVSVLWPSPQRFWALLALLIFPSGYGGYTVFSYAEPFLTGRTITEPLVLVSLALWLLDKRRWAIAIWILSASVHPLQAAPAAIFAWLDLVRSNRRWLNVAWLGLPVLVAVIAGFGLPQNMQGRFDPEWLRWVAERTPQVFLTRWEPADWAYLAVDVFLVIQTAGWTSNALLARFSKTLVVTSLLCILASLVVADGLQSIFGTALQLWRAQWLLHWLAVAMIPWLLFECHRRDGAASPRFVILLAIAVSGAHIVTDWKSGWFSSFAPSYGPSPLAVVILIPMFIWWAKIETGIRPTTRSLLTFSLWAFLVLSIVRGIVAIMMTWDMLGNSRYAMRPEFVILSLPLVAGVMVAYGIRLWNVAPSARAFILLLLLMWVGYSVGGWDRRTIWTKHIERVSKEDQVFGVSIEPGSTVYWRTDLIAPWLALGASSYYTRQQMAGVTFSRGTAEAGNVRAATLRPLEVQLELCNMMSALTADSSGCQISESDLSEVCRSAGDSLDYVVLDGAPGPSAIGSWSILGKGLEGDKPIEYYLYPCRAFSGVKG